MTNCPSRDVLQKLLAEELTEAEQARLWLHVELCTECQRRLDELTDDADTSLWRAIMRRSAPGRSHDSAGIIESKKTFTSNSIDGYSERDPAPSDDFLNMLDKLAIHEINGALGPPMIPLVPGYDILAELGRGGMGVVYKAMDLSSNQLVALKMIPSVQTSPQQLERFHREARVLAKLQHPNVVAFVDLGQTQGWIYVVLEYVDGGSLQGMSPDNHMSTGKVIELLGKLASTIHVVHQCRIVHRDLKPANILLTAGGEPKITDFGTLKDDTLTELTPTAAMVGTPGYSAPEQFNNSHQKVSPAADIYALGAILYELLTDRPPFVGETAIDTIMQALHDEPIPPRRLKPKIPRDLETICLKCLQKEPSRRYPSAAALAEELQRCRAGQPIRARPISPIEKTLKWIRRRPAVATLVVSACLLTILGTAGVFWQWQRAEQSLREAEKNLYYTTILAVDREWQDNNVSRAEELLAECPLKHRRWEWSFLKRRCHSELLNVPVPSPRAHCAAFSPDGKSLAIGHDGGVLLVDAGNGKQRYSLVLNQVDTVAFSPNGKLLASGDHQFRVRVWHADSGKDHLALLGHKAPVCSVAFSPDDQLLASSGEDATVKIWSMRSGKNIRTLDVPFVIRNVAFSTDGTLLAAAGGTSSLGEMKLWEIKNWTVRHTWKKRARPFTGLAFSPDGKYLVAGTGVLDIRAKQDALITMFQTESGIEEKAIPCRHAVESVAFSPDGKQFAVGTRDVVDVYETRSGKKLHALRGHTDTVMHAVINRDGSRIASASFDGTVKVWDALSKQGTRSFRPHPGFIVNSVVFSPKGLLASAGADDSLCVWNPKTNKKIFSGRHPGSWLGALAVAFSPNDRFLASASRSKTVKVWDLKTGRQKHALAHPGVLTVSFHPDSRLLATAGDDRIIKLWDVSTGRLVRNIRGHTNDICSIRFAPDGESLASAGKDKTVRFWNSPSGNLVRILEGHTQAVNSVGFSPNGKHLVSGSGDETVRVWDVEAGKELLRLPGHTLKVTGVVFSPDGSRIASASDDRTIRIWDASNGRQILVLTGHEAGVNGVDFSADGNTLATASWDGTVAVWNAPPFDNGK